jgi:colanic acid/amylovoran biosynthesis glycosyltransferase
MKICVITGVFPAVSEKFILDNIVSLVDVGYDICIVAEMPQKPTVLHQDVIKYGLLYKTTYIFDLYDNKKFFSLFIKKLFLFKKCFVKTIFDFILKNRFKAREEYFYKLRVLIATFDPSICLYHIYFGHNGVKFAFLRELFHRPILVSMLGDDIYTNPKLHDYNYKEMASQVDLVIPITEYLYHGAEQLGVPKTKMKVIPLMVNCDKFVYVKKPLEDSFTIITVARLHPDKGYHTGLLVFQRILCENKNLRGKATYNIIGGGELKEELKQYAIKLEIADRINFLGARNENEVIKLMQDADLFFLPSVKEGLGVVFLEAQAVGLPIIATNIGGIPEVVKDGVTGFLFSVDNINGMASKILELMKDSEERRKIGMLGREWVVNKFDKKTVTNQLLAIYGEMTKRSEFCSGKN